MPVVTAVCLYLSLQAARDYGYALLSRSPHQCSMTTPEGGVVEYDILHMLDFDSNRRCMSIVVRQKGHSEIILYSKGADSAIYGNLRRSLENSGKRQSCSEDQDMASLPSQKSETPNIDENQIHDKGHTQEGVAGGDEVSKDIDSASTMGVALMRDHTQNHLDDYAKLGLRTLCMAKKVS